MGNFGYPKDVINLGIKKKISGFKASKREGSEKCSVYWKIPWIGNVSLKFEKQTKNAVNKCIGSVFTRVIFLTRKMMPSIRKDRLPSIQRSNVVYKYLCHCDSVYVGRTSQRLEDRSNQHIPKFIRNQTKRTAPTAQLQNFSKQP